MIEALVLLAGAALVALTLLSAVRTVVLPRGVPATITTGVFLVMRRLFGLRLRFARTYGDKDRVLALYAPLSLLLLPGVWLTLVLTGYMGMFWSLGVRPVRAAFTVSGSSLLTLGFAGVPDLPTTVLAFTEAAIGIGTLALMISYLPAMYAAFSRRETLVSLLETRASSPPSGVSMLWRYTVIHGLDQLDEVFASWERWFSDVEESHTTLPALVFFRSPQPERSWITSAGAVLDAAAFTAAAVRPAREPRYELEGYSGTRQPRASLCIRSGFLCLSRIAGYFGLATTERFAPNDPDHTGRISVRREEFDEAWDRLAEIGTPLVADREQAWRDFAGWRVNYDADLLALCSLTMAPPAPWSADRAPALPLPNLFRARRRNKR